MHIESARVFTIKAMENLTLTLTVNHCVFTKKAMENFEKWAEIQADESRAGESLPHPQVPLITGIPDPEKLDAKGMMKETTLDKIAKGRDHDRGKSTHKRHSSTLYRILFAMEAAILSP